MEALCKVTGPVGKSANISTACSRLKGGSQPEKVTWGKNRPPAHGLGKLLTSVGPPILSSKWGHSVHLSGLLGGLHSMPSMVSSM